MRGDRASTSATDDPMGLVGNVLDGQFRVDQWIGEGGFSFVYRGMNLGLNEPIAVKCLKLPRDLSPEVSENFSRRFRDESRIAYRLSQGNLHIVRSMTSGTTHGADGVLVPYMVLEWLEGVTLSTDLRKRREAQKRGRSLDETAALFGSAAEALAYAHSQGVVHRDVKPGNLFITKARQPLGAEALKVLDFGLAKVLHDGSLGMAPLAQSVGLMAVFSAPYAAPEQFDPQFGAIGPWTDVYSLALVLFEVLGDRRVRAGESMAECWMQACGKDPTPTPRARQLPVGPAVDEVFSRALAQKPEGRPQDVGQFWGQLRNAMTRDANNRSGGGPARPAPPGEDGGYDDPATIIADTNVLFDAQGNLLPVPGMGNAQAGDVDEEEPTRALDLSAASPGAGALPQDVRNFMQSGENAALPRHADRSEGSEPPTMALNVPPVALPQDAGVPSFGRAEGAPRPAAGAGYGGRTLPLDAAQGGYNQHAAMVQAAQQAAAQQAAAQQAQASGQYPGHGQHGAQTGSNPYASQSGVSAANAYPSQSGISTAGYPSHSSQAAQPPNSAFGQGAPGHPGMYAGPGLPAGGQQPPWGPPPPFQTTAANEQRGSSKAIFVVLGVVGLVVLCLVGYFAYSYTEAKEAARARLLEEARAEQERKLKEAVAAVPTAPTTPATSMPLPDPTPQPVDTAPPVASGPTPVETAAAAGTTPGTAAGGTGAGTAAAGAGAATAAAGAGGTTPRPNTVSVGAGGGGGGGGTVPRPTPLPGTGAGAAAGGGPTPIADPNAFNQAEAQKSLRAMESILASCKRPEGPSGTGKVRVTFGNDGTAMSSVVSGAPFEGTPVGDCAALRFKSARVPKFEGPPGVADYQFRINK